MNMDVSKAPIDAPAVTVPGLDDYTNLVEVVEQACKQYATLPAFSNLGKTITYADLYQLSEHFAAYLQNETSLKPGDRIAIQIPNVIQFPIAVFGALRAGMVVVNTNPLYTAREMEHQFNDSGAKALVVLANMAHLAEVVLPHTDIEHVFVTEVADIHKPLKRKLINAVVKHVKKMVPSYNIPNAIKFPAMLARGSKCTFTPYQAQSDDIAVLQYTGGTTGVAKGAMLTHRNLLANLLQVKPLIESILEGNNKTIIAPLPLYHIFSFTVNCMAMLVTGNHNVLITNPRDIPGFIKELKNWKFHGFLGLNTLFVALCNNKEFRELDTSNLIITISGGMALTKFAAEEWEKVTGCNVCEGYGLTEASPVVSLNPPHGVQLGTIGKPMVGTQIKTIDDEGNDLPEGQEGELCVKGPQVMKGYWQKPEETAKVITPEGWLKTGDIVVIQNDGYIKLVDRKKDMIIVSGFNVYPNELEDVIASHPGIIECAAIGVPDDKAGEAIKIFVVRLDKDLSKEAIIEFCREQLTGYKIPRFIEFRDELPKTNVGKILRRSLRDEDQSQQAA